jgi:type II secretion system protein I
VRRASSRGFTLLEVLVATALLGLAVVTLLGLHARNLALLADVEERTEAMLLASAVMAQVQAEPYPEEIEERRGDFSDDPDDAPSLDGTSDIDTYYGGAGADRWSWRVDIAEPELLVGSLRYVTVEVRPRGASPEQEPAARLWTVLRRRETPLP